MVYMASTIAHDTVSGASTPMGQTGDVPAAVGSHPQHDVFADEFLDHARDNLYNAQYDRPALSRASRRRGRTHRVGRCLRSVPAGTFSAHDLADPMHWLPDDA